jgi:hypothetical protein
MWPSSTLGLIARLVLAKKMNPSRSSRDRHKHGLWVLAGGRLLRNRPCCLRGFRLSPSALWPDADADRRLQQRVRDGASAPAFHRLFSWCPWLKFDQFDAIAVRIVDEGKNGLIPSIDDLTNGGSARFEHFRGRRRIVNLQGKVPQAGGRWAFTGSNSINVFWLI